MEDVGKIIFLCTLAARSDPATTRHMDDSVPAQITKPNCIHRAKIKPLPNYPEYYQTRKLLHITQKKSTQAAAYMYVYNVSISQNNIVHCF